MVFLLAFWRLLCLVVMGLVVWQLAMPRHRPQPMPRSLRVFGRLLLLTFGLCALLQGIWAVYPGLSPGFRANLGRDRRVYRLQGLTDRRPVADRWGEPLIENELRDGEVVRRHVHGAATAHVLGYHHVRFGQTGVEAAYNDTLFTARRPAWGTLGALGQPGNPLAEPLRLTIDWRLQEVAAEALGDRAGAVVVVEPATGDVLVLVSAPSFDPNDLDRERFAQLSADDRRPLLNRALAGLYPPASTYKAVTAAAALAAGWGPGTTVDVPPGGFIPPGETQPIRDYEASRSTRWAGHGELDMRSALALSANGYFAALGLELGAAELNQASRAFGLTDSWSLTPYEFGADTLRAKAGSGPREKDSAGITARDAIGQGRVLATPLHMALVMACIANDGVLVPPHVGLGEPPRLTRQVLAEGRARQLAELLRAPVEDPRGTARALRIAGLSLAAKTGSAENTAGAAHGWLVGFAPVEAPRLAWAVLVEHGGTGSGSALPIARQVLLAAQDAGWFASDDPEPTL